MLDNNSEFVPVTPKQLSQLLLDHAEQGETVGILGQPGGGKTEIVQQVATAVGKPLLGGTPLNITLLDSTDGKGLPAFNYTDNNQHNAVSMRWVKDERYMQGMDNPSTIMCDEYPNGTAAVMASFASVLLEKRLDDIYFHPDSWVVWTGNRASDKAASNRIPTQVANRCYLYELHPSAEDWVDYEVQRPDTDILTVRFIRMKGSEAFSFDPTKLVNPTPRNWSTVARKIAQLEARGLSPNYAMLAGRLGKGLATELNAFRELAPTLPSREEILLNPTGAKVPDDPSAKFLVSDMLADFMSPTNVEALVKYMKRLPKEFQALVVKTSTKRDRTLFDTEAFTKWAVEFSEVLR